MDCRNETASTLDDEINQIIKANTKANTPPIDAHIAQLDSDLAPAGTDCSPGNEAKETDETSEVKKGRVSTDGRRGEGILEERGAEKRK